jgi:hypothetical protein
LLGIYVNWTKPFFDKNLTDNYEMEDFELIFQLLSCLLWKKYNGEVKLYTDSKGLEFYEGLNLINFWDFNIDTKILDNININPQIFWAGGKIFAINNENTPFFIIDNDFAVWNKIPDSLLINKILAIHDEEINNEVYPNLEKIPLNKYNYNLVNSFDWSVKATNGAFTYFNDTVFKKEYCQNAIEFMKNHSCEHNDSLIYMVFAEQRLFSMIAQKLNINIQWLLEENSKLFTHLWGFKRVIKDNEFIRNKFIADCLFRLEKEFPEYYEQILTMEIFKNYRRFKK